MRLLLALLALMLAVGAVSFWAWRAAPGPPPCQDRDVLSARSPDGRALYERLGFVPTNEMRYTGKLPGLR